MELNPLAQIQPVVVIGTILVFTGTYFLLRRVFFDPVIEVLEERRTRCEEASALCHEAGEQVAAAELEAEAILREAQERADDTLRRAREAGEAERSRRLERAKADADERLALGRAAIASEKALEVEALTREARACVGLACEKLVGGADSDVISEVVDRTITKTLH